MKEEIQKISKLVAEGKLSPEEATELIDAIYEGQGSRTEGKFMPPPGSGQTSSHDEDQGAGSKAANGAESKDPKDGSPRDPFKSLMDSIDKLVNEGKESVNWQEVAKQAKDTAMAGFDKIKSGIDDLSKGKFSLNWLTAQEARILNLPLNLGPGKVLKVDNACGGIKVVGGFDVGNITAHARFKGATNEEAKQRADAFTLVVEESDHYVIVRQPDLVGVFAELEIQIPKGAAVELKSDYGNVEVVGTGAGIKAVSRHGDVTARGGDGPVDINTESGDVRVIDTRSTSITVETKTGDIKASQVKGNINARSATGDIAVLASGGRVISLESVSGEVKVDLEDPVAGSLNIRTVNGHALVGIPDGSDCRVSLSTLRGTVECTLDLTDRKQSDQRVTGRLGGGSGTLDISAVTGSIKLELRDSAVTA